MEIESLKTIIEEEIKKPQEVASIVEIVKNLILLGYLSRASDIHLQPREKYLLARYRIDGIVHNFFEIPKVLQDEIISRIKILSNLRIDEHFAAQDGRFRFYLDEEKNDYFDIRVSIMPTYYGENAILRLLVSLGEKFTLENLGLSSRDLEEIKKAISRPYGMILATGPTGSGKTTMLYTILNVLNTEGVHIITIEDPVEYAIPGITQIQVNPQTNLTFGKGLRAILRQDPDIIMVGEIRDEETASIAVNAALTGHLLLSTLHTNDAPGAIVRLLELGVEPYLIASTVNVVIGQRLVRKICNYCRKEREIKKAEIESLKEFLPERTIEELEKITKINYGEGCKNCNNTGYYGRTGVYEVLSISDEIRELILKKASSTEIKDKAIELGMTTILEDGIRKVIQGITTIEEVLRVSHE
ncbi:putative type II secretion system protein HxcR [bacterium HR35]|nr:putative type II secretion system protein HxcR [bacterium HR35]